MDRDADGNREGRKPKAAGRQERESRLAEALRANLKRRKAQERGRKARAPGDDDEDAGENGPRRG